MIKVQYSLADLSSAGPQIENACLKSGMSIEEVPGGLIALPGKGTSQFPLVQGERWVNVSTSIESYLFLARYLAIMSVLDVACKLGVLEDILDEGGFWRKRDLDALVAFKETLQSVPDPRETRPFMS
jgi:hypothetical protein